MKKSKKITKVPQKTDTHTQGEIMSETKAMEEMMGTKPNPSDKEQPSVTQVKAEKKEEGGIISLITSVPSLAWNKAIMPAFNFVKEMVLRAWDGMVNLYHSEVAAFKELGATSYFLGRGAKLGIKLFKVIGAAAAVAFINTMLFNLTGISIFDPITLGIIALVALILVIGSSYSSQKKMGSDFSLGTTGRHLTEAVLAA
jgi:hypothetical protein